MNRNFWAEGPGREFVYYTSLMAVAAALTYWFYLYNSGLI